MSAPGLAVAGAVGERTAPRASARRELWATLALFLLPAVVLFTAFVALPILDAGYYSLFRWNGYGRPQRFVGLGNFQLLFASAPFLRSLANTAGLIAVSLLVQLPLALLLALLVSARSVSNTLFRMIFFVPFILSEVATGLIWSLVYDGDYGLVAALCGRLGLPPLYVLSDRRRAVAFTLVLASMAAYCFAQFRFLGSRQLYAYLLLGLMFPFATAILPLFLKIRDLGLLDTPWGVILPQVAFGLAFSLVLFRSFFEELPKELFEAARVDGCGYARFFFRFTLPLSAPILSTVAVFVFVSSWNNFLLPLVVLNDERAYPWTLGMMQFRGVNITDWGRVLASVTLTLAPALAFFVAAQRYIVAGLTGGSVKG